MNPDDVPVLALRNEFVDQIFRRYHDILYGVAMRKAASFKFREMEADDFLQLFYKKMLDKFEKIKADYDEIQDKSKEAFFRTILMRIIIDEYRRENRRTDKSAEWGRMTIRRGSDKTFQEDCDPEKFIQDTLAFAENLLNDMDLTILSLHLEGYNNTEIAGLLGMQPSAVNTRLHRIRKKLRDELDL